MKLFLSMILFIMLVTDCNNQITDYDNSGNSGNSGNNVSLITDRKLYHINDNIKIKLINNSDSAFAIGLICGEMLDMFYQINENDTWSDNINLYLLGCPTFLDSIKSKGDFSESIPSSIFKSTGTFRLVINENVISNSFIIN